MANRMLTNRIFFIRRLKLDERSKDRSSSPDRRAAGDSVVRAGLGGSVAGLRLVSGPDRPRGRPRAEIDDRRGRRGLRRLDGVPADGR